MKLFSEFKLAIQTLYILSFICISGICFADDTSFFGGEWYVSWGYNKEYYENSDIHIKQSSLGNDFTFHQVQASDYPQWNTGWSIFDKGLFDPQYNLRIGRFIDQEKSWAIELNYDHSKYNTDSGQTVHVDGKINGNTVNEELELTPENLTYFLHNGANHIMINAVKRFPIWGAVNQTMSGSGLFRFGAGIMLPHSGNTILGHDNDVGPKKFGNLLGISHGGWWRLNGWTTGLEAGIRFVVYNPIFIEFTDKEAFAQLLNIPVYEGTASQYLWMNEIILTLGYTFNG